MALVAVTGAERLEQFQWKYCRMCALELRQGVSIFGDEGKRLSISQRIRKTVAILVLEEDSLPKKICTDCCSSLEDYSKYKDTVLDAQEKLTSIVRNLEKSLEHSLAHPPQPPPQPQTSPKEPLPLPHSLSPQEVIPINDDHDANLNDDEGAEFEPEEISIPSTTTKNQKKNVESSSSKSKNQKKSKFSKTDDENFENYENYGNFENDDIFQSRVTTSKSPKNPKKSQNNVESSPSSSKNQKKSKTDAENSENLENDDLFQCGVCGAGSEDRDQLRKHHETTHDLEKYPEPIFGCALCPRISENYNAIRIHIYRHLKEGSQKCPDCDRTFPLKDQLERHRLAAHNPPSFSCKMCGKRFVNKCSLVLHMTSKHPLPPHPEPDQQTNNSNKQKGNNQEAKSSEDFEYQDFAPDSVSNSPGVSEPDQDQIETTDKNSPKIDDKMTTTPPVAFEVDVRTTKDLGTWKCSYCDKIFQTKVGYSAHIATHKGKRFECDYCTASFTQKGSLAHHITSRHNESPKQFKCDKCPKEFVTSKLLRRHNRLHLEPAAESKCPVCQKTYKTVLHLKSHMKLHKLVKKFKCTTCSKSFPNQHKLNHHENTHTGLRPFQCPHCNYAARSTGPFYRHVKAHQKKKEQEKELSSTQASQAQATSQQLSIPITTISSSSVFATKSHPSNNDAILEDLSTKSPQKQQLQQSYTHNQNNSQYSHNSHTEQLQDHSHQQQDLSTKSPQKQTSTSTSYTHSHQSSSYAQNSEDLSTKSPQKQQLQQQSSSASYTHISLPSHSSHNSQYSHNSSEQLDHSHQHQQQDLSTKSSPQKQQNSQSYTPQYAHNSSELEHQNHSHQQQLWNGKNYSVDLMDALITTTDGSSYQHYTPPQIIAHQNQHGHPHGTFVSTSTSSNTITVLQQNEPMELSYKLSTALQDMPMELTKVFQTQRDPLELCVRQEFAPLMDLSSRVNGVSDGGMTISSIPMSLNSGGGGNQQQQWGHKLDLAERELSFNDLSGAFRQPIDLIARAEDPSHQLGTEGSLVDLSLRSSFVQDQSASSFLRELIDLSARSESFHGELNLTNKPNNQHQNNHKGQQQQGNNLPNVIYQDAMFTLN